MGSISSVLYTYIALLVYSETENRYRREYEAAVNPFNEFKSKETKRGYERLNAAGMVVY